MLTSGNAHPALTERLARELGVPVSPTEITTFADGETKVQVAGDVRGKSVFVVQPTCSPVNDRLMVLALVADAARAAGARHVTGIIPYFGYARQEQRSRSGDPRSAQIASRLLGIAGIDHLIVLDIHSRTLRERSADAGNIS